MNDLDYLANLAEIVGVVIVVGGLLFALLQMRQIRQQRRELAAIELFRFFGNPQFTTAYLKIMDYKGKLDDQACDENGVSLRDEATLISVTMENIGVMTYQRIVPFVVVSNLIGGGVPLLWEKLEPWVLEMREAQQQPAVFEWFQWLSERLLQYKSFDPEPAYVSHKAWMPAHLRHHI